MGSVVAGAGVNPAAQRWGFWPLLPLGFRCMNWSEALDPELSLEFCAIRLDCVQLRAGQIALADD